MGGQSGLPPDLGLAAAQSVPGGRHSEWLPVISVCGTTALLLAFRYVQHYRQMKCNNLIVRSLYHRRVGIVHTLCRIVYFRESVNLTLPR